MDKFNVELIKAKVKLNLRLTERERALYLLYIATKEERDQYLVDIRK